MIYYILILILSYDIWFYISHIILHNYKLYSIIHNVHHSIDYKNMNFKDTYVSHFIESPFQGMGIFFPLIFINFNTYAYLYSITILNIRGMLKHDVNYIWLMGNHHILHHTYSQYNFGEYWLDKLFGTNYPNVDECKTGLIYI
jgi:sterol desaturase/sphingolipid hydroxylase (fatty acid hydroxylase superfamily)